MSKKPFLLLQSRPEDAASDNEYEGFLEATGLMPQQLQRIRAEAAPLEAIDLDRFSGIIFGGGPYNQSDAIEKKTDTQKRVEADFARVLDTAVEKDFPVFGACYGVGVLTAHQGGVMSKKYGEEVAAVAVTLSDEGQRDPLLAGLPATFQAIVGHKEACEVLPPSAVNLASSPTCPVQMFRIKNNLYATQFHPELDLEALRLRMTVYVKAGYFPPEDLEPILDTVKTADLSYAPQVLRNFVARYQQ